MTTKLQKILMEFVPKLFVLIRGADPISTLINEIPDDIIIRALTYGWQQAIADSTSSAARDSVPSSVHESGEDAVKAWIKDDENAATILATRIAQAHASIDRKKDGDWAIARSTVPAFTELELAIYDLAVSIKSEAGWSDVATAFAGAKGKTTKERTEIILACVATLSEERQEMITRIAKSHLAEKAEMKALSNIS